MPLRRLALLSLAACGPAPAPAPAGTALADIAAPTVPADRAVAPAAVPADRPAVPADAAAPRLVHPRLERFAALADGGLLVEMKGAWVDAGGQRQDGVAGLQRLDPGSGALTPWAQAWRPAAAGWQLAEPAAEHGSDPRVSPDGRWVALQHVFMPRRAPRAGAQDVVVIVVSRADGSEPRCVGTAILEDEGVVPPLEWTADSRRLIGGWSGQCEPDARGRIRDFVDGDKFGAWPRPMRWFEPEDGGRGESAGVWHHALRDPLGDAVAAHHEGEVDGLAFFDLRSGARLGVVADAVGEISVPGGWLAADLMLADVYSEPGRALLGHRILHTDGSSIAAPGPGWRVYTRLADGDLLFTRDDGASVEQGRIDPSSFVVAPSRTRPELARFAGPLQRRGRSPTWTPAPGGVLIHEPEAGALWLAGT